MDILLTGSSGSLGNVLMHYLAPFHNIIRLRRLSSNQYHFEKDEETRTILHIGSATPANNQGNASMSFRSNLSQLSGIIETLYNKGVKPSIVYASAMSVYGDHPLSSYVGEDCQPNAPTRYGLSKFECEQLLHKELINGRLASYVCLRLPGVLAPNSAFASQNFLSVLISKMMHGESLIELRNKDAYFNNVVTAQSIFQFIQVLLSQPCLPNTIFNLASWPAITLEEVVLLASSLTNWSGDLVWTSSGPFFYINIAKAVGYGFAPLTIPDSLALHIFSNSRFES